ncbi:MAG TPA: Rieske 2Fe-2S domain-containing protein [Candidatus Obscuribacterales bacterium]
MAYQKIANRDDVWQGELKAISVGDTTVVLTNLDGRICAYEDRCPHKGVPLSHGKLEGETLTCAAHHWQFDVCSGKGVNPCTSQLKKFPVKVAGDDVLIDLSGHIQNEAPTVGPILQSGYAADAVVRAIQQSNQQVTVIDRGAYLRVLVPERCTVTRQAIEANLGRAFMLPGDLEMIMTAFKGQFEVSSETASWISKA